MEIKRINAIAGFCCLKEMCNSSLGEWEIVHCILKSELLRMCRKSKQALTVLWIYLLGASKQVINPTAKRKGQERSFHRGLRYRESAKWEEPGMSAGFFFQSWLLAVIPTELPGITGCPPLDTLPQTVVGTVELASRDKVCEMGTSEGRSLPWWNII